MCHKNSTDSRPLNLKPEASSYVERIGGCKTNCSLINNLTFYWLVGSFHICVYHTRIPFEARTRRGKERGKNWEEKKKGFKSKFSYLSVLMVNIWRWIGTYECVWKNILFTFELNLIIFDILLSRAATCKCINWEIILRWSDMKRKK